MQVAEKLERAKRIAKELDEAFEEVAVCHCGAGVKDHGYTDNHSASWNPCPDSKLLYDARRLILDMATLLSAAEEAAGGEKGKG